MFWIITKGPIPGRGSSNVHGPQTKSGPTKVFSEEAVGTLLGRVYGDEVEEIRESIRWLEEYDG